MLLGRFTRRVFALNILSSRSKSVQRIPGI